MPPIPIIDVFAGPGGLAEGFSSLLNERNERIFKIALSIEKDETAHKTLKLRSFYRQFPVGQVPDEYYEFIRGNITIEQLYQLYPNEKQLAEEEAWCGTLGTPDEKDKNGISDEEVDIRIRQALNGEANWALIGGPPCQAYSLVGRARRQELTLNAETDKRVNLYKEYLRIIAAHNPSVFVMENVKGMLSAETQHTNVFQKILRDLKKPKFACEAEGIYINNEQNFQYRIYSLTTPPRDFTEEEPIFRPQDFIIKAEDYGVPQRRHRVILLGIREDINQEFEVLTQKEQVSLKSLISNLPKIRSGVTKSFTHSEIVFDDSGKPKKKRYYKGLTDSETEWKKHITGLNKKLNSFLPRFEIQEKELPTSLGSGFIESNNFNLNDNHPLRNWFADDRLNGVLHHNSRKHLLEDLKRYLFASRYTQIYNDFPRLEHYKKASEDLLPDHENTNSGKFTDRFRVQLPNIPATTVTSHISKDGHYFIHYDPVQCRSLTVREAARIQTFPDNYYFCGERTNQYHQVGNAVPPYLAFQIAEVVSGIFENQNVNNEYLIERINE
ncbi:DNA cytosine methyltransferase [Flavobacterium amniphilum]|uniref:DNA cytosine methyltransferase n=1 Tax=Flavobacterium amniphilum TaxID=1834035 RepID=UPI002029E26B|nr:DNA cytosine methyltransferase [Flavobacterium amniphilum]MCL9805024.1 DNA cytosine methyltransferase [Flavobacterium amniphilum]